MASHTAGFLFFYFFYFNDRLDDNHYRENGIPGQLAERMEDVDGGGDW